MPKKAKKHRGGRFAKERYKSEGHLRINKEKKQSRHLDRMKVIKERRETLKELVNECQTKFSLTPKKARYILKRVFGSLRPSKLEALLSGDVAKKKWFCSRQRSDTIIKIVKSTGIPSEYLEAMSY